eukprot:4435841-Pyramimonas_sp.AAC.1
MALIANMHRCIMIAEKILSNLSDGQANAIPSPLRARERKFVKPFGFWATAKGGFVIISKTAANAFACEKSSDMPCFC